MKLKNVTLTWGALVFAILAGILGSLVTLAFREIIEKINLVVFGSETDITQAMHVWPWLMWPVIVGTGGVIAGLFLRVAIKIEKERAIKTDYLDVINARLDAVPTRTSLFRAISSIASISSGASIGKEGPMVQLAALCGSLLGRFAPARFRLSNNDVVAMAAAAGLASVYHAPLASAIFVAEIAFGITALQRLIPLIISSGTAVTFLWSLGIDSPLYPLTDSQFQLNLPSFLLTLTLGALCGLLGAGFITLTAFSKQQFAKITSLPVRLGVGGALVGGLAILSSNILGNGYEVIVAIFSGHFLLMSLIGLLVLKVLATCLSVGSGAVGGMFTPSLLIGALIGGIFGVICQQLGLAIGSPWLFAVIGMAAVLAAISQAPLMAILMVLEMTLNSSLLFPLMMASVIATMVTYRLHSPTTYPVVSGHFSRANAKFIFDNTRISDLAIPSTCLQPNDSIGDALEASNSKRERYVYVIDEKSTFIGVVSIHAIAQQVLSQKLTLDSALESVIEREFPVVYQYQSLRDGWDAFSQVTLERLPVLNNPQDRQFVGALTKTSLVQQAETFL